MTAIADLVVPARDFELGQLVIGHPGVHVELERIVPLDEGILPFFWVSNADPDEVEGTLRSTPEVAAVARLTELEDRVLYQVEWSRDVDGLVEALVDVSGTVLSASGADDEWRFQLRFPDHDALSAFGRTCEEKEIDIDVKSVYNPHPPTPESRLTAQQRRTLRIAHARGYFEVPRRTTLPELASYFGVSKQAVSQRIRRGLNNLLVDAEL
jgi:predicted DNA binding protein